MSSEKPCFSLGSKAILTISGQKRPGIFCFYKGSYGVASKAKEGVKFTRLSSEKFLLNDCADNQHVAKRAQLVLEAPEVVPKNMTSTDFLELLDSSAKAVPASAFVSGTAWKLSFFGQSMLGIATNSNFTTVVDKHLVSYPLSFIRSLRLCCEPLLFDRERAVNVYNFLVESGKLRFASDVEFLAALRNNIVKLSEGMMIVADFELSRKRYGVVVLGNSEGQYDVIYRPSKPCFSTDPKKVSYFQFAEDATTVFQWSPGKKLDNLAKEKGFQYTILPKKIVAKRAKFALKFIAEMDSVIGSLASSDSEKYLYQLSVATDDWRWLECELNVCRVFVRVYNPEELQTGDIIAVRRSVLYTHVGVVHSFSETGEIFIGHFGSDDKTDFRSPMRKHNGSAQITTLETFMKPEVDKKAAGLFRIEYLGDARTKQAIKSRIEMSVQGQLFPEGRERRKVTISQRVAQNSRVVPLTKGTEVEFPIYFLPKWNCEDWAFWIVKGGEGISTQAEGIGSKSGQGCQGCRIVSKVGANLSQGVTTAAACASRILSLSKPVLSVGGKTALGAIGSAVGGAVEIAGFAANRFIFSSRYKDGRITEDEYHLMIKVENNDAKKGALTFASNTAAVGVTSAAAPIVGTILATIATAAISFKAKQKRQEAKKKAIINAIWQSKKKPEKFIVASDFFD